MDVSGKTAVITGGATGIGFGIAQAFAARGAKVVIAGHVAEQMEEGLARLREEFPEADITQIVCDVMQEDQVQALFAAVPDVDYAIANAGSGAPGGILQLDADSWKYCCELNILGTALTIKHAGLAMKGRGGSIVTVSSVAASRPGIFMAPYSTSKAAVETLTKCAAVELGGFNIRVNCIAPGFIWTESTSSFLPQRMHEEMIRESYLGRKGMPDDIADTVLYLCTEQSRFVTGQVIAVDAGLSIYDQSYEDLARALYGDAAIDAILPGKG
ncbi:MAG: SDR family NAD(P)-dependent oxidoreductase [Parvibaculales bacterium]